MAIGGTTVVNRKSNLCCNLYNSLNCRSDLAPFLLMLSFCFILLFVVLKIVLPCAYIHSVGSIVIGNYLADA